MYRCILVPLDGSETGEGALQHACGLGEHVGARLILLRAVEPHPAAMYGPGVGVALPLEAIHAEEAADAAEAEAYLARIADALPAGLRVDTEVRRGEADATIIAVAAEMGCDLIVMATHSRAGIDRLLHGSVTEQVVREAGIPVLVIHAAGRAAHV